MVTGSRYIGLFVKKIRYVESLVDLTRELSCTLSHLLKESTEKSIVKEIKSRVRPAVVGK